MLYLFINVCRVIESEDLERAGRNCKKMAVDEESVQKAREAELEKMASSFPWEAKEFLLTKSSEKRQVRVHHVLCILQSQGDHAVSRRRFVTQMKFCNFPHVESSEERYLLRLLRMRDTISFVQTRKLENGLNQFFPSANVAFFQTSPCTC